ncbi:MAG: hypothetical protein K2P33_05160 [Acutalibacter sp.]|nr:hypothetical protein [Acutalibacter sp.]
MAPMTQQIAELANMLPEEEQLFAYEFMQRLVRAWDPDFTKLTPEEKQRLDEAEQEIARGETVSHKDITWD